MRSLDLQVEVTAATGLAAPAHVAASLFLPDTANDQAPVELLVCLHGGGYRRNYWHPTFAGPGYSFAEYFTSRGRAVLTLDHLGMGESTRPEPEGQLTRLKIAAANHQVTAEVVAGLKDNRWGMGAKAGVHITGVGHSIGGMMVVTQAAQHRSFDRVAVLGWANQPMVLGDTDVATLSKIAIAEGYHASPRQAMRALFYMSDVPLALIEADEAAGTTTPSCLGRDALTPGIVHQACAAIDKPVFVLHADVDTSPNPHGELAFFTGSPDVTLMVLKDSAHCHNFATRRRQYWDRLDRWIDSIAVPGVS